MSFVRAPANVFGAALGSVDLVAFDTETTGLDTRIARIIEIAGVRIASGRALPNSTYAGLVNPGARIPQAASAIHGIVDGMVADAPGFRERIAGFADWAGPTLLLGFSVTFDLAVLEAEHRRHGLLWSAPDTLDVQELARTLRPDIRNWTLESVARWLSLDVADRHRALADAEVTAEMFARLIPLLRQAGIETVGQAMRACETGRIRPARQRPDAGHLDSFPFCNRVGDVMSAPPAMIDREDSLRQAVGKMVADGITSLFVSGFADGRPGILTESDVMRAISGNEETALDNPAGDFCSRPLTVVSEREFIYRAIVSMTANGVRHLGIVDAGGQLVGAVTAKDTLSGHGRDAITLGREIETAANATELGRIWSDLGAVVRSLVNRSVAPPRIAAVISRELRALTERACGIAEMELADRPGNVPGRFALLVLGSGGRGESLLAMDQDNAIVFGGNGEQAGTWHTELGKLMSSTLHAAGVKLCNGGIMASNPEWCRNSADWSRTISEWMVRTNPSDLMNIDIFFDAVPVYGDPAMANRIRESALRLARANRPFLSLLARRACDIGRPFGMFGRWKLDSQARIDLKRVGLMPVASAARALALEHGIANRSTAGRLRAADASVGSTALVDDLIAAHGIILGTVLRQQLRDIDNGIALSNRVAPSELSNLEQQELRWAVRQVPRVADLLGVPAEF